MENAVNAWSQNTDFCDAVKFLHLVARAKHRMTPIVVNYRDEQYTKAILSGEDLCIPTPGELEHQSNIE